jgi:hypothetical protein
MLGGGGCLKSGRNVLCRGDTQAAYMSEKGRAQMWINHSDIASVDEFLLAES